MTIEELTDIEEENWNEQMQRQKAAAAWHNEVAHPAHYTQGAIECIEVLEQLAADGHDFRVLAAMKYLWRYRHKGGNESLAKAVWYIQRVIKYPDNA